MEGCALLLWLNNIFSVHYQILLCLLHSKYHYWHVLMTHFTVKMHHKPHYFSYSWTHQVSIDHELRYVKAYIYIWTLFNVVIISWVDMFFIKHHKIKQDYYYLIKHDMSKMNSVQKYKRQQITAQRK